VAAYTEMDGWPQEQIGENGQFYAERKLKCAWEDRYQVLQDLGGNGGQLYPYDILTDAYARGATIVPFGAMNADETSTPIAAYNDAIVTIKYSTDGAVVKLGTKWVTEELQPTAKLMNVNWEGETWVKSGNPPVVAADNITRLETAFDYVVTYYHLLAFPAAAVTQVNKINSDSVASYLLGLTFNPETLLHTRPVITRTYDPGIRSTFRLVYRFSFNPHEWNKHWKDDDYYETTGDPLYPKFPFASLIP